LGKMKSDRPAPEVMETAVLENGTALALLRMADGGYCIAENSKVLAGLRWRSGEIAKCLAEFQRLVAVKRAPRSEPAGKPARTPKRVLVVDDEPQITGMLKLCLERLGPYTVQTENDSTKVMTTAREFCPDVIILDIMMPEPDGSELAAFLQEDAQLKQVPVIFLTALVSRTESLSPKFGFDQRLYLAKPVDFAELVEHIEQLGRSSTVNGLP
jgi:CheY-like chemotaxis protein